MEKNLDSKELLEWNALYNYFFIKNNIKKILNIINQKHVITLNLILFFVTKYCPNNNVTLKKGNFIIYSEYKKMLKTYGKKYFDIYNRQGNVFEVEYSKNFFIKTTFKQLNFLRWIIKNDILKYIVDNFDKIKQEKNECSNNTLDYKIKKSKNKTKQKITKKKVNFKYLKK